VQGLASSQLGGGPPAHAPPAHVSAVVQALPSLQDAELFACVQPPAGLQASSVQGFASSQFKGAPPTHAPPLQVSFVVQMLPSLHEAALFVCTHPLAALHESLVQGLPSSQPSKGPPRHTPPLQVSSVVQALPSLHGPVLDAPPWQTPPLQVSPVVQTLPSSHGLELFE